MTLTEPATLITDYILSLASLFFATRLLSRARRHSINSMRLWGLGFAASAAAAAVGGTYHGFTLYLDQATRTALWNLTVFLLGLTAGFMLAGTLVASLPRTAVRTKWLIAGGVASLIGFLVQQSGFGFHVHFNHNDVYHLIQLLGIYFFYRGALLLKDQAAGTG